MVCPYILMDESISEIKEGQGLAEFAAGQHIFVV